MENLLNADIIKTAASSPLGLLCLMCLILGIITLAFFREANEKTKIFVFVLLLVGVFGFGFVVTMQPSSSGKIEPAPRLFPSRWYNSQKLGNFEAGSTLTYYEDGTFSGVEDSFNEGKGQRLEVNGKWDFKQLAPDMGHLTLIFDNGSKWQSDIKIIDNNRMHIINGNYDSVRLSE